MAAEIWFLRKMHKEYHGETEKMNESVLEESRCSLSILFEDTRIQSKKEDTGRVGLMALKRQVNLNIT